MSTGQLARNRSLSLGSGNSSSARGGTMAEFSMSENNSARDFEPTAATASMFLYAQGSSIVCCHHDTLSIERRFSRHTEEISLLAVDMVSERGAGRLVVSYDIGQTAIVWDLMTGDEIARFASYDNLTVAAWMRNGNVAFGNAQGAVILFEPSTSEHLSAKTMNQIPITSLAPATDCRTYAIGYRNGSLVIAALQPRFTILHTLVNPRDSPVVTLAWHASSSRQKSDMLASQTRDGDLRVWSIAKSPTINDTAKVVRVLKRSENFQPGQNWLGWSKNGRIIQFSEGETSSWDVRTKNVTCETVPTLEHVRGLAVYGPGATLFTLGRSNTVQQFDLNSPPQMVANVQHPANFLPPSPPVSIEEQKKQKGKDKNPADTLSAIPLNVDVSESDEDHMSPLARIAREMDKLEDEENKQNVPDRAATLSPVSSRSYASMSSRSSAGSRNHRKHTSTLSRGMSDATSISIGSTLHSSHAPSMSSRVSLSQSSMSSHSHSSYRSRPRASRLRQEVLRSPEEKQIIDLFKFTKSRLSDVPYTQPKVFDNARLTNDDLRRQMLSTIFGWDGEVDTLIQDEISHHSPGSPSRLLLAKWLGDIDTDIMATGSESMTSSDWMLLALSGIGGSASQHKVARAYVQRLLEKGDVHTAATIMLGMGDQNDAIEIYTSHKRFMEALILTCLVFPVDWQRQTALLRKWGEWAVQHSQQQLAIRCFSCTASESSEPWTSPSAQAATFSNIHAHSIPEVLSPPLSPPGVIPRGPQRNMAKTSALKLITTFGDQNGGKSKFFGVGEDDRTPMGGAGATPIAESALSPRGEDTAHTAFLRPNHRSAYNTPASARTATPGGFKRQRLPSIGEMPSDVVVPRSNDDPARLPTPADSGSDKEKVNKPLHERKSSAPEVYQLSSATYSQPSSRAATASPMVQKAQMQKNTGNPLPSPSPEPFTALMQDARTRNGSRDRKPDGLQIQWPPLESIITGDYMTSPEPSLTSSRRPTPHAPSVAGSVNSMSSSGVKYDQKSPLISERSYKSLGTSSPVVTGRSLDQYISSLESAQHHALKQQRRQASRDRHEEKYGRGRSGSRKNKKTREPSEDRGRSGVRYIKPAKRSPTSPVPMSPEDLHALGAEGYGFSRSELRSPISEKGRTRDGSQATAKPGSKPSSRVRRMSIENLPRLQTSKPASRVSSRNTSRRQSPDPLLHIRDTRGRSKGRESSAMRSPSSPLPMSPQAKFYQDDEDDADLKKAQDDQARFRSRQRSTSRMRERGTSAVRHASPDRRLRDLSGSRKPGSRQSSRSRENGDSATQATHERRQLSHHRNYSEQKAGDLQSIKSERALKKELAARELEERRKSLALRPSVPPIVHPEEIARLSPAFTRSHQNSPELNRASTYPSPFQLIPRSQTTSPEATRTSPGRGSNHSSSSGPQVGLPATPRAMRHPKFDPEARTVPDVPQIPDNYGSTLQQQGISYNSEFENLGTLPKTTYQAVPRHVPARSMSAPIPEEPPLSPHPLPAALPTHPAFQTTLPPSSRRRTQDMGTSRSSQMVSPRRINPGEAQPGTLGYEARNMPQYAAVPAVTMVGIDETIEANSQPINPSNNNLTPPPPPPAPLPPILKELQHLAQPPPPPPAPLYVPGNPNTASMTSGVSQGSDYIEIVMDNEETSPQEQQLTLSNKQYTEMSPPPPPPPAPTRSRTGSISHSHSSSHSHSHSRSGSITDNSLSGRFSRATEKIRSASRSRSNATSPVMARTMSPHESPYESIQSTWADATNTSRSSNNTPAIERHPREVKATYNNGQVYMEGGMI